MPSLEQFKDYLASDLGFKDHQINDGNGQGVASIAEGLDDRAVFLASTSVGNCYAAFNHEGSPTLSEAEAERYKALSILMRNGPAAYCVIEVGSNLRLMFQRSLGRAGAQPYRDWERSFLGKLPVLLSATVEIGGWIP